MLLILLQSQSAAVTHDTSGALTGPGASVTGDANRTRVFDTTGALTGPGAEVAGSSTRTAPTVEVSWLEIEAGAAAHDTSGALIGPGSTVTGSANHATLHATTGALSGPGSTLSGTATRFRTFSTSGALTGQGSTLSGAATRFRAFGTSGTLVGPGSTLSGSATRFRAFGTSGDLIGPGSTVTGSAARAGAAVTHDTSGALVGAGAEIVGQATLTSAAQPIERGDGVDAAWTKKQRRERDRKLAEERERKDELRQLLKRALDPVVDEPAVEVVTLDDGVVVIPSAGPAVAVPRPEGIDLRAMSREIGKILADAKVQAERTRRAQAREIARVALEQARENLRRLIRKRQQEEFLLLMT